MTKQLLLIGLVSIGFGSLSLQAVVLLDPAGAGGFENGSTFAANGWTIVNHATNNWYLGALGAQDGTSGAYISNDAGTTTNYTLTSFQTSHFYRDITVPSGTDGCGLTFKWKAGGESTFDRILVYAAPTTVTPVAGTPISGSTTLTGATLLGVFNLQSAAWQTAALGIGNGYNGSNLRLIFTWQNDSAYGVVPGGIIDYIAVDTAPALTGVKTINPVGGDYTSFTSAIIALNLWGVGTGGVTFNVAAGTTYTELCPALTATGTSSNPIIFRKSGTSANPIIYAGVGTGTQDAIMYLNGVDYLTWDGIDLMENSANTTTNTQMERGLWVTNSSSTNGSQYNTFKNFRIILNRTNTSTRGVYNYYGTAATAASGTNSYNDYYNVTIENTNFGMYFYGTSATYMDDANLIRNCTVGGTAANDIGGGSATAYGIYITYQKGFVIRNNVVRNVGTAGSYTAYGIYMSTTSSNTTQSIYANQIYNIACGAAASTSYYSYGIYLSSYTTGTNVYRIYNNMIWGQSHAYAGTASASRVMYGIYLASGGATCTYNIDFNSIRISGPVNASSFCVAIGSVSGTVNLRNNILANYTGTQVTSYHGCIYTFSTATPAIIGITGSMSDRNVLYIDNPTQGYIAYGGVTVPYATLANWQATVYDDNSRIGSPAFISATELHINEEVLTSVESVASYFSGAITWVTTDVDGEVRNASTPDIGADEGEFNTYIPPPLTQPTNLVLVPSYTQISGSFTPSYAEMYLVIRSSSVHNTVPVNGITYVAGNYLGNGTVVQAGSSCTFTATELYWTHCYYITVYAYNVTGTGTTPQYCTINPIADSTVTLTPPQQLIFTASAINCSTVDLAITGGVNDSIMVAWNSTNDFGVPASNVNYIAGSPLMGGGTVLYVGNNPGLTDHTGLWGNTTYYYKAFSFYSSGIYKVYSTGLTASATTLRPENPAVFTAIPISYSSIGLAATANASGNDIMVAWNYINSFGTPNPDSTYTAGNSMSGGGTIFYKGPAASLPNHTGLSDSTTYYYKIWSFEVTGSKTTFSTGLTANATTFLLCIPQAPENVQISALGNNATITWDAVTQDENEQPIEVDYYIIYKSAESYGTFNLLGFVTADTLAYTDVTGPPFSTGFYYVISFSGTAADLMAFLSGSRAVNFRENR